VQTVLPPEHGPRYNVWLPKPDADGTGMAGIRTIFTRAPIGTNVGWNLLAVRPPDLCRLSGSFVPFAKTRAERLQSGDSRLSLEERYGTHDGFVRAVQTATQSSSKSASSSRRTQRCSWRRPKRATYSSNPESNTRRRPPETERQLKRFSSARPGARRAPRTENGLQSTARTSSWALLGRGLLSAETTTTRSSAAPAALSAGRGPPRRPWGASASPEARGMGGGCPPSQGARAPRRRSRRHTRGARVPDGIHRSSSRIRTPLPGRVWGTGAFLRRTHRRRSPKVERAKTSRAGQARREDHQSGSWRRRGFEGHGDGHRLHCVARSSVGWRAGTAEGPSLGRSSAPHRANPLRRGPSRSSPTEIC
jgi:hypothetical protein